MKLLPDENLPKRLKQDFPGHEVFTVRDKNLQYQQNFNKYNTTVFVLTATINTYKELARLSGKIQNYLSKETLQSGSIIIQPG